jgi:hypothetical protein
MHWVLQTSNVCWYASADWTAFNEESITNMTKARNRVFFILPPVTNGYIKKNNGVIKKLKKQKKKKGTRRLSCVVPYGQDCPKELRVFATAMSR